MNTPIKTTFDGAGWFAFRGTDPLGPDPDSTYGIGWNEQDAIDALVSIEADRAVDAPVILPAPEAVCRCGQRRYASEAVASIYEPNGLFKCPTCHTFAKAHPYFEGGEGRCGDCDTRSGSHGGPR